MSPRRSAQPRPSTRLLVIAAVVAVLLVIVAAMVAYLILRQPPLEPLVIPSSTAA